MCSWLFILICMCLDLNPTTGYLYPYETETRETRSLDGLWDFKICPENKVDLGFTDHWHSRNLEEVSIKYTICVILKLFTCCNLKVFIIQKVTHVIA